MNTFLIKSRPEQRSQFDFLIRIVSLIPGVKNWHIDSDATYDLLKVETSHDIDRAQIESLIGLYEIQMEVQS